MRKTTLKIKITCIYQYSQSRFKSSMKKCLPWTLYSHGGTWMVLELKLISIVIVIVYDRSNPMNILIITNVITKKMFFLNAFIFFCRKDLWTQISPQEFSGEKSVWNREGTKNMSQGPIGNCVISLPSWLLDTVDPSSILIYIYTNLYLY